MAYTTIDDPSAYFQNNAYTGNGGTRSVVNDGNSDLQPDWVWIKKRNDAQNHTMTDSNRGLGKILFPDVNDGDSDTQLLTSFDSDGYSLNNNALANGGSQTYATWQWKANGGTTSALDGGDITTTVQTNTTAGFSIITYSGAANASDDNSNNSGAFWRLEHGLGAVPHWIISKKRSTGSWYNWHHKFPGASSTDGDLITSDGTSAFTSEGGNRLWGNSAFSSTEYEIGGWDVINRANATYVAYLFTEIQGYSKFGSYKGNGNADGPFVYTGFAPAWVMSKNTADSTNWNIWDNVRDYEGNPRTDILMMNANDAGADVSGKSMDFLSNGFKLRGTDNETNDNGDVHIYMAFAQRPFVSSEGVPSTAVAGN